MKEIQIISLVLALLLALLCPACEGEELPLGSKARRFIDSTSTAQIRQIRRELDSLCLIESAEQIDYLVDSLKKERLREIETLKNDGSPN